ncbi:NIPSNAP family protein [Streptacidiphilus rugosus]|uniref:NIPSNAP family protein n=1 Tax=Streptacidiphilus rugosus TaxID=405783 RepID=UPI00055A20D1|nr:NIPSNAP family protein [Streptacidiphilus rugosus]
MFLEIRTYRLVPGTRADFVRAMREEAIPLLRQAGIRVVDSGPSLSDEDGHEEAYLIRAFASLAEHRDQEAAFYGSEAWLKGPREAIVSRIESYHSVVIEAPESAAQALTGA